jgi:hypothetical protein
LQFPSRKGLTDRFGAVIRFNHPSLVIEDFAVKKLSAHINPPAREGGQLSSGQWSYLACTAACMRGDRFGTATGGFVY